MFDAFARLHWAARQYHYVTLYVDVDPNDPVVHELLAAAISYGVALDAHERRRAAAEASRGGRGEGGADAAA